MFKWSVIYICSDERRAGTVTEGDLHPDIFRADDVLAVDALKKYGHSREEHVGEKTVQ